MATRPTAPKATETPVVNIAPAMPGVTPAETPAETPTPAEDQKPAAPAEPVYESEKLTAIRAEIDAKTDALAEAGLKTPAGKALMLEIWNLNQSEANEITAIKKHLAELEQETKKNARIAMFDKAVEAAIKMERWLTANPLPEEGRSPEQIAEANAINAEAEKLREAVVNELLVGYKGSSKAATTTPAVGGQTSGTKGKTTEEIRAIIAPLYAAGVSGSDVRKKVIKEHGFNDGTANAVILKYEQENHLNGK